MSKRVFILGAGFSAPAGLPTQNELSKEWFNQDVLSKSDENPYWKMQKKFIGMLKTDFGIDKSSKYSPLLEDLYTPIDRCILENASFRSFHPEELLNLRHALDVILISAINSKSNHNESSNYIDRFAEYLIKMSKDRALNPRKNNPISVITTNWDTLLDYSIYNHIKEKKDCTLDYMCYITPLDNRDKKIIPPGLVTLTHRKFTIKLLKIHGSINWLQCPKCQRIYAHFHQKIKAFGIIEQKSCERCSENHGYSKEDSPKLRTLMLMPSFEKDLSNFQTKLLWRSAGSEIASAEEITFIGYSFPLADFEFRQLLYRSVSKKAKIKVILYNKEHPDKVLNNQNDIENFESPEYRYLSFFGGKEIEICFKGVVQFVNEDLF